MRRCFFFFQWSSPGHHHYYFWSLLRHHKTGASNPIPGLPAPLSLSRPDRIVLSVKFWSVGALWWQCGPHCEHFQNAGRPGTGFIPGASVPL